jgi:hypothetical protein
MFPCRHCGRIANNRDKVCLHCKQSLESPVKVMPGNGAAELKNDPASLAAAAGQATTEVIPLGCFFLPDIFVIFLHPLSWVLTLAVIVAGWIGFKLFDAPGMIVGVLFLMVGIIVVKSVQEHRQSRRARISQVVPPAEEAFSRKVPEP